MTSPRPKAFLAGAALVWRRQRVLWWIYAANLFLGLVAARGFAGLAGKTLNHSLAANQLVHGFNLERFAELALQADAPLRSSLPATFYFSALFALFMLFSTGGVLVAYCQDRRLTAGPWFESCGEHFWRFLRLAIYFGIVLVPVGMLMGIANSLHGRIDAQAISPYPAALSIGAAAIVILLLLMCLRLWFDMAQVIAVAEYEKKMHRALRRSARLLWVKFGSLFWLYMRISLTGWVLFAIGLHLWIDHLRPDAIARSFLLGQLMIIAWLGTRLWQRASEARWYSEYQSALIASPAAGIPAPPNAAAALTPSVPEGT